MKKTRRGPAKRIPPEWGRRAYYLNPKVIHAVGVLAKMGDTTESQLVNAVLAAHIKRSGYARSKKK